MGNRIGFQADNEKVKLAYVQQNSNHIKFIQNLKSKYLRAQIKWSNSIIFLFECRIQEFINYHTSQNVQLLRSQYQQLLNSGELVIRTNRETINILSTNKDLQQALKDILMKEFKLEHTERIQNSISAIYMLQTYHRQYYKFKNTFTITQLHNFNEKYNEEHQIVKHLPENFLLIILRNGMTAYKIQKGKKTERVDGSIIGEKTILSILKFKYPKYSIQQCFNMAFTQGNLKKVDLMVEDIYGKNSHNLGLPGNIVASSMAKICRYKPQQMKDLKEADIMRSIINTFAINTSNLIALYLSKTNMNEAVVLADHFHNDKFYCLVQCITDSFAPGKSVYFSNHAPFLACLGTAFANINIKHLQ